MNNPIDTPELFDKEPTGDSPSKTDVSIEEVVTKVEAFLSTLSESEANSDILSFLHDSGNFFVREKKFEEAEKCFQKALKLAPERITALEDLGMCFLKQSKYTGVKECFEKITKLDHKNTKAWHILGIALIELEEVAEAEKCFRKVLELDPENIDGSLFLGICLEKQEKGKGVGLMKKSLKKRIAKKNSEK